MIFYITMFACNILIPLIMLVCGYFMYKRPPKDINNIIGYRTKMSRKNIDTWMFAHNYCGKLWIKLGIITLIPSVVVQLSFVNASDDTIGYMTLILECAQLLIILCSVIPVEIALKKTFDENGNKRL